MKKKKQTNTKPVDTAVKETVETVTATKQKSNRY